MRALPLALAALAVSMSIPPIDAIATCRGRCTVVGDFAAIDAAGVMYLGAPGARNAFAGVGVIVGCYQPGTVDCEARANVPSGVLAPGAWPAFTIAMSDDRARRPENAVTTHLVWRLAGGEGAADVTCAGYSPVQWTIHVGGVPGGDWAEGECSLA